MTLEARIAECLDQVREINERLTERSIPLTLAEIGLENALHNTRIFFRGGESGTESVRCTCGALALEPDDDHPDFWHDHAIGCPARVGIEPDA